MSTADQINEALKWRYAVKKFDNTKKISSEDWKVLEDSLLLAPSSYGLQPWKFLIVENKEIRKQLRSVSWGQSQVEDASHFVVFAVLKDLNEDYIEKYIAQIAKVRGVPLESLNTYKEMMITNLIKGPRNKTIRTWAQRQAYIPMGFIMETAGLLKIDTCPMEGIEPEAYDKILKLEDTPYAAVAAVAVGYRAQDDGYQTLKKVRFSKEDVIEFVR